MRTELATFPAFGVDTVARLTPAMCKALKALGYSFAVRYLGGLVADELADILAGGLALMPVTYSRKPGWNPSAAIGESDAVKSLAHLRELGFSPGVTVWLDLEGCAGPAEQTTAWVNAWATRIAAAGFEPGLYVGAAPGGLDPIALWKLRVVRYWRSCSKVPEPANCGFCMAQLYPPNLKLALAGVVVDIDVIQADWKNRFPSWVRA